MKPRSCTCKPGRVDPARELYASGRIQVFIVLNLRNYVEGPHHTSARLDFERLRGGEAFSAELKKVALPKGFVVDTQEEDTTNRAHDFQVFRGHLAEHWLSPTFHLQKAEVQPPGDERARREWHTHEFHVRLSRTGFIEVRITRELPEPGENMVEILTSHLELAARETLDARGNRHSLQVQLALHCANLFVRGLEENKLTIHEKNTKEDVVFYLRELKEQDGVPYRQRYMTMIFRKIVCQRCGRRLEADRLRTEHAGTLAAILEGVLVEEKGGRRALPEMDPDSVDIRDLGSWRDDLCIFAPERALIYYPEKRIYLFGQTGTEAVDYERYWECIARGIEHTVTVRAAMQIIEYETTKHLDIVPALTKKVVDGVVSRSDKREISEMSQEVANTFNLLPLLRDVLVPTSSYRASYAIKKFEHLSAVLNIKDIEGHVDHNVEELVTFVQFFASMKLEDELNKVGLVVGFVALAVAGPSFLSDYRAFFIETFGWPEWTEWVVAGLLAVLAAGLLGSLLFPGWMSKISQRLFSGRQAEAA